MLGIPAAQGRRYSWGYPAMPEQSEHLKVERLLELERIGMTITDGFAPVPEQSTLALIAHHPQAIYFGTRQGRLLPDGSPDDLIKGSSRDPSRFGELGDEDPPDGAVEERTSRRWPAERSGSASAASPPDGRLSAAARCPPTARGSDRGVWQRRCTRWSRSSKRGAGGRYANAEAIVNSDIRATRR